ncbi:MAG: hypothetical protein PHE10_07985, partial [Kiritimatiellae bacterium]|nr:hypothetical protein [Kiritimatiellia bacterium]
PATHSEPPVHPDGRDHLGPRSIPRYPPQPTTDWRLGPFQSVFDLFPSTGTWALASGWQNRVPGASGSRLARPVRLHTLFAVRARFQSRSEAFP